MKYMLAFAFTAVFSHASMASELQRLQDIEPLGGLDRLSIEDVERAEQEMLDVFGEASFEVDQQPLSMFVGSRYNHVDPHRKVPSSLLAQALHAYDQHKSKFPNQEYLTVVDFSKRSNKTRFFVINMNSGNVWALRTAHGSGGDLDHDGYVESVSNVSGSHKSSKGFYRVAEIYHGRYGRSIRLDGLSSTNSNARARAIVLHGSDYVVERNVIQGRSWGCFVLAWSVKDEAVSKIAGGSLLYADFSGER